MNSAGAKLTLTGNNTYTGTTNVTAGTLIINGDNSLATGNVMVAVGATLGGSGTIGGNTTISGIHSPGNSTGIQTFNGNLSYTGGASVVKWELIDDSTSNSPTTIFDQIIVTGDLDFVGSTGLNLDFSGVGGVSWLDGFWATSKLGTSGWLIYDVSGTPFNLGNFNLHTANWADGGGNLFNTVRNGSTFSLSQQGSDVYLNYTISAVPEPSSALLLGCGAAGFAFYRRRQKRLAVAKQ